MKYVPLFIWLFSIPFSLHAQQAESGQRPRGFTDTSGYAEGIYRPGRMHLIKVYPAFFGLIPRGGTLAYETGLGLWPFSVQVSAKYFAGTDSLMSEIQEVRPHWRFEIQPRFWGIAYLKGIFIAPLFDLYDNLNFGVGGLFGYQQFITKNLLIEGYIGVQSNNPTENYTAPIFLRYGFSLGWAFRFKK